MRIYCVKIYYCQITCAYDRYIETNGNGATVRPWVWVVWLFLGPTIYAVGEQWYMFVVVSAWLLFLSLLL